MCHQHQLTALLLSTPTPVPEYPLVSLYHTRMIVSQKRRWSGLLKTWITARPCHYTGSTSTWIAGLVVVANSCRSFGVRTVQAYLLGEDEDDDLPDVDLDGQDRVHCSTECNCAKYARPLP
eukprot:5422473-Amphidinium_carterae.2